METRRWPRRNDPESIRARQETLGLDGEVTAHDLAPFAGAQESLTGVAVTPVSVVGPLRISLGDYELTDAPALDLVGHLRHRHNGES